jgi:hypothetical protein
MPAVLPPLLVAGVVGFAVLASLLWVAVYLRALWHLGSAARRVGRCSCAASLAPLLAPSSRLRPGLSLPLSGAARLD